MPLCVGKGTTGRRRDHIKDVQGGIHDPGLEVETGE